MSRKVSQTANGNMELGTTPNSLDQRLDQSSRTVNLIGVFSAYAPIYRMMIYTASIVLFTSYETATILLPRDSPRE